MFNWLRNLFSSPAAPPAISNRENRELMARYDNVQQTAEQQRLWWLSDPLSAKSANSFQVRRIARMRSRYEHANNSYLAGSVERKVKDLIGCGPTIKFTTGRGAKADKQTDAAFAAWWRAARMTAKLRTQAKAKVVDGEGFLVLTTSYPANSPVKLMPREVEADQIATPFAGLTAKSWVDGVVLDELGNVVGYNLLKNHPGDLFVENFSPLSYDTIAARYVLHWFRQDRPGQVRGVPETLSTLDLWGEMRRFRKATVTAAEAAAQLGAAYLETEIPPDPTSDDLTNQTINDPGAAWPIERGVVTVAPWGSKLKQIKAEHPTTTFDSFTEKMLGECSRGIGVPLNVVLGTSQKFNFSSAKLDHIGYYADLDVERYDCEEVCLRPLVAAWLDEAVMVPGLLPDGLDIELVTVEFHWPPYPPVDPLTDAKADTERLANNRTLTFKEYFARQGKDWAEQFAQFAKEQEEAESLGLAPVGQVKVAVNEQGDEPDGDEPPAPKKQAPKKKAKDGAEEEEPAGAK